MWLLAHIADDSSVRHSLQIYTEKLQSNFSRSGLGCQEGNKDIGDRV